MCISKIEGGVGHCPMLAEMVKYFFINKEVVKIS